MNEYFKNLKKIEFVITYACTGQCRHCSEGEHTKCGEHIDIELAEKATIDICSRYNIKTVMTFGGEPLIYPNAVYKIMSCATKLKIPKRQVITNGFFSSEHTKIHDTAMRLAESGVNELLISADAFHQETIPLKTVKVFALEALKADIPVKIQPAWLVSEKDANPFNQKTRRILEELKSEGLCENEGNVIFPEGNALKYLSEYFVNIAPANPYVEDPTDIRCLSFSPDGSVLKGNIHSQGIIEILNEYKP